MKIINSKIICLVISILLISFFSPVSAQENDLDSLISVLDTLPSDTSRINHLDGLAKTVMYQDPKRSLEFANEGLLLSLKLDYKKGTASLYKTLGNIAYMRGNYTYALNNYLQGLELFILLKDPLNIANIYNNIGILYDDQKNVSEAKRYYKMALQIYRSINEFSGQATIYHNLGVLHSATDLDSAKIYLSKALLTNKELKDEQLDALTYGNLGYVYMNGGTYDTARLYFERALQGFEKIGDVEGTANQYLNLGELLQKEGNYAGSLSYLKFSENISEKNGFKVFLIDDYKFISNANEKLGNHKEALKYFQKYKLVSDSIFADQKNEALSQLQAKNEHAITLANLNIEKNLQQERLEATKIQNYLLIAVTGFALLIMLISSYYFLNKHRVSIQLQEQNTEILIQKKKIETQKKEVSKINKDLKEKNHKLNQLNKEKDYLMHVVAHDLKSPLNQMSGLAQIINFEPENLTSAQKNCLEKIETVSTRLSNMVDKILDIEAIEKKSNNMIMEEVDLREVIEETVEEFEAIAHKKDIDISANVDGQISLVKLDKQHAIQVFSNLISNAIKFSPPHRKVEINLASEEDEIVAEVKDEGPGLTSADKQNIFKKFTKLSAQPTANEESNGLGLSIVKKYVEEMNGRVWVESNYGHGANFKVSFQKS